LTFCKALRFFLPFFFSRCATASLAYAAFPLWGLSCEKPSSLCLTFSQDLKEKEVKIEMEKN